MSSHLDEERANVRSEHVETACDRFDRGEDEPAKPAVSTFLVHRGREYPAKHVRRLAFLEATGRLPRADELSGGIETVSFFTRLGFPCRHDGKLHKPASAGLRQPSSRSTVPASRTTTADRGVARQVLQAAADRVVPDEGRITKVARVNLITGVSKSSVLQTARSERFARLGGRAKGTAHRSLVRDAFLQGRAQYLERIGSLVDHAVQQGADIVVLPATSLLTDDRLTMADYGRRLAAAPFLLAGRLDATSLGHKDDQLEGSIALRNGIEVPTLSLPADRMAALGGLLGTLPAIVAVSSTVRNVRTSGRSYASWVSSRERADVRLLICDLGHEQYSGRYLSTLQAVQRHASAVWRVKSVVVLAQWRYLAGARRTDWVAPDAMTVERLPAVPAAVHADEVDLITIKWDDLT